MMRAMVGYAWIECRPHHKCSGHANPPYRRCSEVLRVPGERSETRDPERHVSALYRDKQHLVAKMRQAAPCRFSPGSRLSLCSAGTRKAINRIKVWSASILLHVDAV